MDFHVLIITISTAAFPLEKKEPFSVSRLFLLSFDGIQVDLIHPRIYHIFLLAKTEGIPVSIQMPNQSRRSCISKRIDDLLRPVCYRY